MLRSIAREQGQEVGWGDQGRGREQSLGRGETRSRGRGRGLRNAWVYYDIISLASHEAHRVKIWQTRLQEFWADSRPEAWRRVSDGTIHSVLLTAQDNSDIIFHISGPSYLSVAPSVRMCCIIKLLSATWGLSFSAYGWSLLSPLGALSLANAIWCREQGLLAKRTVSSVRPAEGDEMVQWQNSRKLIEMFSIYLTLKL